MSRNTKATDSLSQVFDWWAARFYQLDELVGQMQERLLLHCMSFPRFSLHLRRRIALNKSNFMPFDAKPAAFQIFSDILWTSWDYVCNAVFPEQGGLCRRPWFKKAALWADV